MRPFNINEVEIGDICITRDGRDARIICLDAKGKYPIVALVPFDKHDESEFPLMYSEDGRYSPMGNDSDLFLK